MTEPVMKDEQNGRVRHFNAPTGYRLYDTEAGRLRHGSPHGPDYS